jgi:predicted MFS family arabinose efflux permease
MPQPEVTGKDTSSPAGLNATPPSAPPVRQRWRGLALLTGAMVVDSDENKLVTTIFPALRSALAIPTSALGVLVAIGQLIGMISSPVWTWLARRTNRKIILVICSGLWGGWSIGAGFAQNYLQLLILYTVAMAGFMGAQPIINELLGDLFDDKTRGRATGYLYGALQLANVVLGPLMGLLSLVQDGWRYGFFASGALNIVAGVLILAFFTDPGIGAAEPQLAGLDRRERDEQSKLTWAKLRELMRVRTFQLMLVQRLLSSHLLILTFGVVFLVDVYHYSNAVAAIVLMPMGIGYFLGTWIGGEVTDRVSQRNPRTGRIFLLQVAQLAFAVVALSLMVNWGSILIFSAIYAALGFLQGVNPGINRPIVMSTTRPELRGPAFVVMLSIAQAIAWAIYSAGAGYLAEAIGMKAMFFWLLGVVMIANAAFVTFLYRPYIRDCAALQADLAGRTSS